MHCDSLYYNIVSQVIPPAFKHLHTLITLRCISLITEAIHFSHMADCMML